MTFNLLHDRLIRSDAGWHSLPELLAAMARGEVSHYPSLRPHQRPAWHMFLVQLSVMALDAIAERDVPRDDETWRAALRSLTPDHPDDAPWQLIVTDRKKPAFLQPPDPGGLEWTAVKTPDALDMLITARNHDIKREIAITAEPQDWIFALVSLQTMEGLGGKYNHGTVRMSGGSSSRVLLGLAPTNGASAQVDPSAWWSRDVSRLVARRNGISGRTLLWQEPWPEGCSFDLDALDTLFIDSCRRIRLSFEGNAIRAERSTSKDPRVASTDSKGNLRDPWAPVFIANGAGFTLKNRDWTPELLVHLLFSGKPKWKTPLMAEYHASESSEPMVLIAEAFARGQSKTYGFKSRVIPVPKAVVRELFGERVRDLAPGIIGDISMIELALRDALALVAAGGAREKVKTAHYARTTEARQSLRRQADQLFFPEIWKRIEVKLESEITPLRFAFLKKLIDFAEAEFARALPSIPCSSLMRPKAEARGHLALRRRFSAILRDYQSPEVADVEH